MKKKYLLIPVFLVLFYPLIMLFRVEEVLGTGTLEQGREILLDFQISIWICWVVLACIAVYYKWTQKRDFFFVFCYGFLLVAFGIFGYLSQEFLLLYSLDNPFKDNYTYAVLQALQNIVMAGVLTGFLQGAVWWFTRRWHRR
ncbi:hypothetical protein [Salinimicrobium soli]|uniref:hypothetical protein n=1 Tax=Salinimicrobium soli TaxID=1254399 RepID=UPI003AAC249E